MSVVWIIFSSVLEKHYNYRSKKKSHVIKIALFYKEIKQYLIENVELHIVLQKPYLLTSFLKVKMCWVSYGIRLKTIFGIRCKIYKRILFFDDICICFIWYLEKILTLKFERFFVISFSSLKKPNIKHSFSWTGATCVYRP